ncbi:MAG: hypothetical protein ACTSXP_05465, partial [Promethearchaeota archaeon]
SDGIDSNETTIYNVHIETPILIDTANTFIEPFNNDYANGNGWTNDSASWQIMTDDYISQPSALRITSNTFPVEVATIDTPLFNLTSSVWQGCMLSFWYKLDAYPFGTEAPSLANLTIFINENNNGWTNLNVTTNGSNTWFFKQVDLSSYMGSIIKLRFLFFGPLTTNLLLDDVKIYFYYPGIPSLDFVSIDPENGTEYSVFTLVMKYSNTENIYPEKITLKIYEGGFSITPIQEIEFSELYPLDNDVTDGKLYFCNFQVYGIVDPRFYCYLNDYPFSSANVTEYVSIQHESQYPQEVKPLPFEINFDNATDYVIVEDAYYGAAGVVENSTNKYYFTGNFTGNLNLVPEIWSVSLITPIINLSSDVDVHLSFDHQISYLVGLLSVDISIDGNDENWTTLISWTNSTNGIENQVINLNDYKNNTVRVRFYLETTVFYGGIPTFWIIDNISFYEIDTVNPEISFVNIEPGQTIYHSYRLELHVDDVGFGVSRVIIRMDSTTIQVLSGVIDDSISVQIDSTEFSNGNHLLVIVVIDKAGNLASKVISVNVDNTPYTTIIVASVVIIAVTIAILSYLSYKMRKEKVTIRELPSYLLGSLLRRGTKPKEDFIKKVLDITKIYRKISLKKLVSELEIPNLTTTKARSYINYMLSQGLIDGKFEGKHFNRIVSKKKEQKKSILKAKMQAVARAMTQPTLDDLLNRDEEIIRVLKIKKEWKFSELLQALDLDDSSRDILEDFLIEIVKQQKISCMIDGDKVIVERTATSRAEKKVNGEIVPAAHLVTEEEKESGRGHDLEKYKGRLINYLSASKAVLITKIPKTLDLDIEADAIENLEDFIMSLVLADELEGYIDNHQYIQRVPDEMKGEFIIELYFGSPALLKEKTFGKKISECKSIVINALKVFKKIDHADLKKELGFIDDTEQIKDFLTKLVEDGEINGDVTEDSFILEDDW